MKKTVEYYSKSLVLKSNRYLKKYVSEDIVASENLTRERVANVFQLPSVFLNARSNTNFAKNEELNRFYLQHTLLPIVKQYEEEFNRKLLTKTDREKK